MSDTKELLIINRNGSKYLVKNVPADAKVTFSAVNPAGPGYQGYCVRIYESENKQLAVFTEVASFRDLSLKVLEQKVDVELDQLLSDGPNGQRERRSQSTKTNWEEVEI